MGGAAEKAKLRLPTNGGSDHAISRWCKEDGQSGNTGEEQAVSKEAYQAMQLELRRITRKSDILKNFQLFSRSR